MCDDVRRNCTLETQCQRNARSVRVCSRPDSWYVAGGRMRGLVKGGKKEEKGVSQTTRHSWEKGTRFDRYPEEAAGNNINISFI